MGVGEKTKVLEADTQGSDLISTPTDSMTSSLALFSRLSLHHSGIQLPTCKMDKNLLNVVTVKLNRTVNVKIPSLGLTNNQLSTDKLSG